MCVCVSLMRERAWVQVLLAIHNMAYQGTFGPEALLSMSVPNRFVHFLEDEADDGVMVDDAGAAARDAMQPPVPPSSGVKRHGQHGVDGDAGAGGAVGGGLTDGRDAAEGGPLHTSPPAARQRTSCSDGAAPAGSGRHDSGATPVQSSPLPCSAAGRDSNNVAAARPQPPATHGHAAGSDAAAADPVSHSTHSEKRGANSNDGWAGRLRRPAPTAAVVPAASVPEYHAALLGGYPTSVALGALEVLTWHALLGELRVAEDGGVAVEAARLATAASRSAADGGVAGDRAGGVVRNVNGSAQHGRLWAEGVPLEDVPVQHPDALGGSARGLGSWGGGWGDGRVALGGANGTRPQKKLPLDVDGQRAGSAGDGGSVMGDPGRRWGRSGVHMHAAGDSATPHAAESESTRDAEATQLASDVHFMGYVALPRERRQTGGEAVHASDDAAAALDVGAPAGSGLGRGQTYLGLWPLWVWDRLCIAAERRPRVGGLRRAMNWLRAGLRTAAALVTVSPAYAQEVCPYPP